MTIAQIIALALLGPIAFVAFGRALMVFIHGRGEFHIIEALVAFLALTGLLVVFLGVV